MNDSRPLEVGEFGVLQNMGRYGRGYMDDANTDPDVGRRLEQKQTEPTIDEIEIGAGLRVARPVKAEEA